MPCSDTASQVLPVFRSYLLSLHFLGNSRNSVLYVEHHEFSIKKRTYIIRYCGREKNYHTLK